MLKATFFDIDGTLTSVHTWRGIQKYFQDRGERRLTNFAFWLYHAPLYLLYKLGILPQIAVRRPWAEHLVWYFRGFTPEKAEEVWEWLIREFFGSNWHPLSLELIEKHRAAGDLIVFVSASPGPLVDRIAVELGADLAVGTDFELKNGCYTGRVAGDVCIDENKALKTQARLRDLKFEVDFSASTAYADSSGDVALLEMVGNPVALHPDEHLRPIAEARGWKILPDEGVGK